MKRLTVGEKAPDFSLADQTGKLYTLSELTSKKNVLLVFNIGFA